MLHKYLLLFTVVCCLSCTGDSYPPITDAPTYSHRYGNVVWHELATTDIAASRSFYRELFHWEFEEFDADGNNYLLIRNEGEYIGGMIGIPEGNPNAWISAVSVADTETAVQAALRNGGDVLIKSTRVPGRGDMALIKDPQGAVISFIHSAIGDPALREVNSFEWLWTELWSDRPAEAGAYYSSILPYTVEETSVDDKPYWVLSGPDNRRLAGMIRNPVSNMKSQWIPYIKVVDPGYHAAKAKKLGATVLLEPSEEVRNGTVAVLTDPGGAIFCLQQWPVN